ncbi:MAG: T9SS type A sorting domain-containing protein [Elusimicrobiota bacterium]
MTKYPREPRLLIIGATLALLAALSRPAQASFTLTVTPLTNTFTWGTAVDPSSTTATVLYRLLVKSGLASNPLAGGTTTYIGGLTTFSGGGKINGSYCYVVVASNTVSGIFDNSVVACHSFLHSPGGGNDNAILRGDGSGGQLGFNQTWNLSYYIDTDAYTVLKIYPPGTTFVTDAATGFKTPAGGSVPTATVIDGVPRSGELADGSWKNTEIWNGRNSSGTTVGNGIYDAFFSAYLPNGTTQYAYTHEIPVNIIRFTALTTSGINATIATANINYSLTANASVRVVIAKPGRLFTIDSNGDVQALDASGTAIDTSTSSVIQVLTPTVSAGSNIATWNGLDSLGIAVSSGLYAVGLSAKDFSGNKALDLSGNNGPIQGSIAVDRIPAQSSTGGTAPVVTAISVGGTNAALTGGSAVGAFSSIGITLSATAGLLTTVTLTGPNGAITGGVVTGLPGTAVTFTLSQQTSTGSYSITISPYDQSGTVPGTVQTTQFNLTSSGGTSTTLSNAAFAASLKPFPNPVRTGSATIQFVLAVASTVEIDIHTLTGQRVLHRSDSYASGTQAFSWGLVNDMGGSVASGVYIARVKATNSLGTVTATKKIMVVK